MDMVVGAARIDLSVIADERMDLFFCLKAVQKAIDGSEATFLLFCYALMKLKDIKKRIELFKLFMQQPFLFRHSWHTDAHFALT